MRQAVDDLERRRFLTEPQAALLRRVYERRLLSVYWELRTLLYGGILVLTTGLGLLIHRNLTAFGHVALIAALGLGSLGCLAYCLRRSGGLSAGPLPSPSATYDYVLLLGCLLFGTALTYLELRYRLLGNHWDLHLLASSLLYVLLAHCFDNRLVLSLGLSTLGAWMGVRASLLDPEALSAVYRGDALLFGGLVLAIGAGQTPLGWKRHFLPVHLHLGVNVVLAALVSGVFDDGSQRLYAVLLAGAVAACVGYAVRSRQFALLLYGTAYGYVGLSYVLLTSFGWGDDIGIFAVPAYFLLSSLAVLWALVALHKTLRSDR